MVELVSNGYIVVWLKGGDLVLFVRICEEIDVFIKVNIFFVIVFGIMVVLGVLVYMGIFLIDRCCV